MCYRMPQYRNGICQGRQQEGGGGPGAYPSPQIVLHEQKIEFFQEKIGFSLLKSVQKVRYLKFFLCALGIRFNPPPRYNLSRSPIHVFLFEVKNLKNHIKTRPTWLHTYHIFEKSLGCFRVASPILRLKP